MSEPEMEADDNTSMKPLSEEKSPEQWLLWTDQKFHRVYWDYICILILDYITPKLNSLSYYTDCDLMLYDNWHTCGYTNYIYILMMVYWLIAVCNILAVCQCSRNILSPSTKLKWGVLGSSLYRMMFNTKTAFNSYHLTQISQSFVLTTMKYILSMLLQQSIICIKLQTVNSTL